MKTPEFNPELNPKDLRFQKVENLPKELQDRFVDVEGGFVRESAAKNLEKKKTT